MLLPHYSLAICASFLCAFWVYLYGIGFIWKPRYRRWFPCLIGAPVLSFGVWAGLLLNHDPLAYILYFLAALLVVRVLFHCPLLCAAFAGTASTFFIASYKGITLGVLSVVLKKNMFQILSLPVYPDLVMVSTAILFLATILVFAKSSSIEKLKIFFSSAPETQAIFLQHIAMLIFLLFYSYNYYYNLDLIWFSLAHPLVCTLLIVIYMLAFLYGVRIAFLIQEDIRNKHLHEQMQSRLAHYQVYRSVFGSIGAFEHQFREFMLSAQYLVKSNDQAKLDALIHTQGPALLQMLPQRQEFSNDPSCDAIFHDWNSVCEGQGITFGASFFVPVDSAQLAPLLQTSLNLLRELFMQLQLDGAGHSARGEVFIKSTLNHRWLVIRASTTYLGGIKEVKTQPYFTHPDGISIKSSYLHLSELTTENGGIINFEIDSQNKVFSIILSYHCGD